jgi:ubiquinone/menaquinone biosynthesis C-methylase UbiE
MQDMIDWTGERFIPGNGGTQLRYEHMHRYAMAQSLVDGRRVLDFGSGEGYGTSALASRAASVTGVDIDPEAVAHARTKYETVLNVSFEAITDNRLPYPDGSFDVVTCFEVIEHVPDPNAVIEEIARLLSTDGVLLISTPNKAEYSDKNNFNNEYHLKEFYVEEFREFLQEHFASVNFLGQRLISTSLFWSMDDSAQGLDVAFEDADKPQELRQLFTPIYVIAQCSKSELSRIGGSVFIATDDSLSEEAINSVPMRTVNEILGSMDEERRIVKNQLDIYEAELLAQAAALNELVDSTNEERRIVKNQLDIYEAELLARATALEAADERIRHLLTESPDEL